MFIVTRLKQRNAVATALEEVSITRLQRQGFVRGVESHRVRQQRNTIAW